MGDVEFEVLEQDDRLLFGIVDNLGVIIWRQTPTLDAIHRVDKYFPRLANDPRGFALMPVLTPGCAPVNAEGRSAFDRNMRAHRDQLLGIAIVIEVQGVMGGLTRAIARSMSIVSRTPYPVNTYATVPDALRWLAEIMTKRTDDHVASDALRDAIAVYHTMNY